MIQYTREPAEIIENTPEAFNEFGSQAVGWLEFRIAREDIGALLDGKCLALNVDDGYAVFVYMNPSEVINASES